MATPQSQAPGQSAPQAKDGDQVYRTAVIRPGVYVPGGGPLGGKKVAVTEEFIRNAGPTIEGEPVNLEHSQSVEDEVGFHRNHAVEEDEDGVVLRADLQIQASRQRFEDAISFIESRLAAGEIPEYSMELPTPELEWREAQPGETFQGEEFDIMLTDGAFAGGALLTEGACTAEDGCGVGLSSTDETTSFCPSCGNELPCEGEGRTRVHSGLSGTTRKRTTMSEDTPDETDEGSGGNASEQIEQLQSQIEELETQLENQEAASREDPDTELETELESTREELRGELASQITSAKGEDFLDEHFDEEPSIEQLKGARRMIQAESADEDPDDEGPENTEAGADPDRKTKAQRGPGQDTVVTRSGREMSLEAYNAVRERFGLPQAEDASDLNPALPSAFKRAPDEPDGEATLFHHMGEGN